ncbi:flavin reductase family protein [Candidatus Bathyarchaeota archaeon]|nr:flavin reductase family protein [Candidatus Bathyarchaeota archaeon]
MRNDGILLVAEGKDKKPNTMTIGWGFLGTMWSKPVFVVAVRHSRHTFKLMEEADSFTVCLPAKGMAEALEVCGTKSGRDMDKLKTYNWKAVKGKKVDAPYIKECPVHFECRIIYKDDLKPGVLPKDIEDGVYPGKNMHMLYYGEIKGVYADEDADKKLME